MELGLDRRVAFIAGSSRGIGLAIARAFLREGARVVVTGRDSDSLATAAGLLGAEASADRVLAVQADLTNESETRRALGTTLETFEGIDVVVANVGSGEARGGWELARNEWESVLNLNLLGGVQLAAAALPHLVARRGNLVMISSIGGQGGAGKRGEELVAAGRTRRRSGQCRCAGKRTFPRRDVGAETVGKTAVLRRLHSQRGTLAAFRETRGDCRRGGVLGFREGLVHHRRGYGDRWRTDTIFWLNQAATKRPIWRRACGARWKTRRASSKRLHGLRRRRSPQQPG